jgi:hypothetical protein
MECEMGGNVAKMGNKKNTQKFLIEKPEGKRHLEDLDADGTTLKYGVCVLIASDWFRAGISDMFL